jgi:hypothetical protein
VVASPLGCGIREHDETCLCDVIVKNPTPIRCRIPDDLEHGKYIAELINWDYKDLGVFFEAYTKGMDAIRKAYERGMTMDEAAGNIRGRRKRKSNYNHFVPKNIPWGVYDYLREQVRLGVGPTPLVNAIKEKFNVTIHKSYVTKTKNRMIQRGEMENPNEDRR